MVVVSTNLLAQPNRPYYWKGGSGDFNDPTMWWVDAFNSGTSATQAPNSTNSVFFTAGAFSTPGANVTVNSNSNCDTMFWDNAISVANAPTLLGASSVSLDIYGSFALADNMAMDYNGQLRFRSQRSGIETIDTKDKMLRIIKMDFEGSATTEFRLLSSLEVEDINNTTTNLTPGQGGFMELLSGTLNTNGQDLSTDFFHSYNNNPDRGLILNNSKIDIDGRHAERCWQVDFDTASNNYTTFDATGSHIDFNWRYGYDWVRFGRGLDYDTITMRPSDATPLVDRGVYCYLELNRSRDCSVNHLILETRLYFIYDNTNWFTIHNLYLKGKRAEFGWHNSYSPHIRLENVFIPNNCEHFYPMSQVSSSTRKMTIQKLTPGVLTLNNVIMSNVDCDITGGRSYVANNSIDGNNNDPNWTINEPASRQLYFRDAINNDWHELGNWEEKIGALFVPAGCLPTGVDDVFFDNNSYSSNTTVQFDSIAHCRDITFENTVPAGSRFRLSDILYIFGDLTGTSTVQFDDAGQGTIYYMGIGNSIQTNGTLMNIPVSIETDADYTIIGNYISPGNRGISARSGTSVLRAGSDTLSMGYLYIGETYLDSTQVFLTRSDRWSMYDRGGLKTYTGTATIHFQPATFSAINIRRLPNVIFYKDAFCIYYDTEIQGDLTMLGDGNFSYSYYTTPSQRSIVNVSGSMALYDGDMNLTAGNDYTFSSAAGSSVTIAGDLNAIGNCAESIYLQTTGYATGIVPFTVTGTANIDFASVSGLDNTGNPVINVTNSIDAGNNTNFNFTLGTGTTFYWRALSSDATDFEGDWSDPGHWTTNPASLVGDSACAPTVLDSVIFDNNSFSGTSNGCDISGNVYCKSMIMRADARITGIGSSNGNITESANRINIAESFMFDATMSNFEFRGDIRMIGSGDIQTNGTILELFKLEFNNATGTWNLLGDLRMDNSWAGTNITRRRSGIFALIAGTFNTNNFDIQIPAQFVSTGNSNRTLNLGSSIITVECNGTYYVHWSANTRYPWDVRTSTNLTVNPGTSQIVLLNNTNLNRVNVDEKWFYMGDGINYNNIRFEDTDEASYIYRSANYAYAELLGTTYLYNNNSFDSIRMEGGLYYYLGAGNTQTLNAPHGKLIANGNSGSFVFIESSTGGTTAFLRKPYGYAFCLDFVKVKEVEGTKETNLALVPVAPTDFQAIHSFLEFQTGVNSDNINGTATGIWAFNLPPLVSPSLTNADSIYLCKYGTPQFAPLTMTGTGPYFIDYTWADVNSGTGSNSFVVPDNDNDPATPFSYQLQLPSASAEVVFNINVQTSRCGDLTNATPQSVTVFSPAQDTLVDFPTIGNCEFNNEPYWFTFMDDVQGEPILAIRDSANASDNQSLGMTSAEVFFDATVQTVNYMGINYPYLQRHWDIVPTNNGPASVRLFFTQAELDALAAQTYWGNNPSNPTGTLNPTTDIQILKYSSGTIGVGTPVVVPHTVRTMVGGITDPFSDITDVIAVEIDPASFSHIIVLPIQPVLLTLDLEQFDAKVVQEDKVQIDWEVATEADIDYYQIERSKDAINAQLIQTVDARGLSNTAYTALDEDPYRGLSYYRIKAVAYDGSVTYSDWKSVEIEGWEVVRVYPVPTKEVLNIQLSSTLSDQVSLVVYDALGTLVYQSTRTLDNANQQQLQLMTNNWSSGVYYLQISNADGYTQQRKFVVE
jgi:hypothetical protein